MNKCFCDICGKEFANYSEIERFKIKKEWHSWYESGWECLDVHKECWEEMCNAIKQSRSKEA